MVENDEAPNCKVEGSRIIDVKHMSEQMICTACKTPFLMQDIEQETKRGSIHTGIGETQANKFLNIMGFSGIDSKLFKKHERIIGPFIEYVAKESCLEAAEMERLLTLENIEELKKLFAKAMESDEALELVTKSSILKEANLQVGVFIGDNDSSCISSVQKASSHQVVKQSDMNHSVKGIGNILHEIYKEKASDPEKELTNEVIKHVQRCFSYVVQQNKGDIQKIKVAIENIPQHLFDHHEKCGNWCTGNQENVSGIRLSNPQLFEALKKIFVQLANTGEKFASAASSQANESLNNSIFAAAIAQKNCGIDYLRSTMILASIPWSKNVDTYIEKCDKQLLKRKEKSSQPQKEKDEGNTYQSNITLLESHTIQSVHEEQCLHVLPNDTISYGTDDLCIVFFDLETAGLKLSHEILQLSMKCGQFIFTSFITPTRSIAPATTKANGLNTVHKKLFQHGHEVITRASSVLFQKLLEYLLSLGKKCILVAHNCAFDSSCLILALQKLSLIDKFKEVVAGFSDTLSLFRKNYLKRQSGYKLTTLASEMMSLPCDGAHDASFDTSLLEKLTVAHLLASFGITEEMILETFKTKGKEQTEILLKGVNIEKPQIIKTKKMLISILDYLQGLQENL
ncbi:uncharacterized protein LOC103316775 [Nasonia vitripennis]|uniref:Exonuclease domain-containing protein n=1 Tax=Nasonia vitripennis TaxID=7425 RepID=A0A7M7Q7N8_NASVI|nr:uncharacterized protein LOC103316775 [Nasonia vitripennis]